MDLEEFLEICDEKRKDNINFDLKSEFQALDSEDQTAILSSIKKFQLTEVTSEDKLEKSELAKQEMYRRLKNVTIAKDKLQGSEEISLTFESKSLGEGNEIEDYEGNTHHLNKQGDDYFVFYNGKPRKATISHPYEGYTELSFTSQYDIENVFLKALEPLYYKRCAANKTLYLEEAIDLGMLRETADMYIKLCNRETVLTRGFCDSLEIFAAFEGKSTFLHLVANQIPPEALMDIMHMIPNPEYLNLPNASG